MALLLGLFVLWACLARVISPFVMLGYLFLLLLASTFILEILVHYYRDEEDWKGNCRYETCVASL